MNFIIQVIVVTISLLVLGFYFFPNTMWRWYDEILKRNPRLEDRLIHFGKQLEQKKKDQHGRK